MPEAATPRAQPATPRNASGDGTQEHLQKKLDEADHPLQWLLWRLGCKWSMLRHQPKAVRFCAGVPEGWPAGQAPHAPPPAQALDGGIPVRGGILADDMGLGKTYSSIGGMLVRGCIEAAAPCAGGCNAVSRPRLCPMRR